MDGTLRLNLNENPFNPLEEFGEKITELIKEIEINRYPNPSYPELKRKLATKLSVREENLTIGNGSDELILYIMLAFQEKKLPVVIPYPTFTMYEKIASLFNLRLIKIPLLEENWDLPIDELEKVLPRKGAVLFLAYPNNPTGNLWDEEKIEKLARINNGITIIDEAYYEFSGKSMLKLFDETDNIIVLRTFSKAFGLAGARIGYAISSQKTISEIEKVRLPFNLSVISEKIAIFLLENEDWVKSKVSYIVSEREKLFQRLSKLRFLKVYPSRANFLLCKILKENLNLAEILQEKGIEVRKPDMEGNYIRISIGKIEEVEKLWLSLREIQEKLK